MKIRRLERGVRIYCTDVEFKVLQAVFRQGCQEISANAIHEADEWPKAEQRVFNEAPKFKDGCLSVDEGTGR